MKTYRFHLLSLVPLLLLSFSALAQDELQVIETPDPTHRELNLDEDKILIYDHPGHSTNVRDTTQNFQRVMPVNTKSSKPESQKATRKPEEEEALKFNFLYYMIQKFKLSDLIDQ